MRMRMHSKLLILLTATGCQFIPTSTLMRLSPDVIRGTHCVLPFRVKTRSGLLSTNQSFTLLQGELPRRLRASATLPKAPQPISSAEMSLGAHGAMITAAQSNTLPSPCNYLQRSQRPSKTSGTVALFHLTFTFLLQFSPFALPLVLLHFMDFCRLF